MLRIQKGGSKMISYAEKLLKLLGLEDKVKIGETHNEEAFRLICEEVEKLILQFNIKDYKMSECIYGIKINYVEGLNIISKLKPCKLKHIGDGIIMCTLYNTQDIIYIKLTKGNNVIQQLQLEELNVSNDDYYDNWVKSILKGFVVYD